MRFVESFLGTEISWIPSLGVFLQCFESLFFFSSFFSPFHPAAGLWQEAVFLAAFAQHSAPQSVLHLPTAGA